jgi:malate dehydrogenase (oxaloacetate-decarboxylating)
MLLAACERTVLCSPILHDPNEALLPCLDQAATLSREIAIAVGNEAIKEGVAQTDHSLSVETLIDQITWQPHYLPYHKLAGERS